MLRMVPNYVTRMNTCNVYDLFTRVHHLKPFHKSKHYRTIRLKQVYVIYNITAYALV